MERGGKPGGERGGEDRPVDRAHGVADKESTALLDRMISLAESLRRAGVEVSTGELIDAVAALEHLEIEDRAVLKASLRALMVKSVAGVERFDRLFDQIFRASRRESPETDVATTRHTAQAGAAAGTTGGPAGPPAAAGMSRALLDALSRGDEDQLRLLAAQAVELAAGIEQSQGSAAYFLHRVLRAIDLSRMLSAALQQARSVGELSELELALFRSELSGRLQEFRRLLGAEIAARLAGRHGLAADAGADNESQTEPEVADPAERDILQLSGAELSDLRRIVQPLARQLAARIGRRRKSHATGRLDARKTFRRSLDTGGVPIDVATKRKRPQRPEIVLLCDVSGSVVEFAQFTFSLVNAIHDELSRVRSFAFVDGVGEVTDLFATATYDIAVARFVERKGVLGPDGHSDYGRVFTEFVSRYVAEAVTQKTTILITGDARSNYRPVDIAAFRHIASKARRVYWLNPEREERWNTDDSIIGEFEPYCDGIFEIRTLRQLADVIAELV